MIKLFRKIRQKLIEQSKVRNYFFYAIGEIILVVIGILIALQINTWNQNRIKIAQEKDDLENLKEELKNNILGFKDLDSIFADFEKSTDDGLKIFNNNPKIEDLKKIDSLIVTRLKVFPLTRSTYDEMLNTGKFYNLRNKLLKAKIAEFYSEADNYSQAFIEINKEALRLLNHTDLYTYDILLNRLKTHPINIKKIDTTWLYNTNSPEYLALYKRVNYLQEYSNKTRRELMARQIIVSKELVNLIDNELQRKKL